MPLYLNNEFIITTVHSEQALKTDLLGSSDLGIHFQKRTASQTSSVQCEP